MMSHRIRFTLLLLITCFCLLLTGTAKAQLPACEYPPIEQNVWPWYQGNTVAVRIDSRFSQPMREAIADAVRNWNMANGWFNNCSGIYFAGPTIATIPDNYGISDVPRLTMVIRQRPEPAANVDYRPYNLMVDKALITVGACVNDADSMSGIVAHEIGHTFALRNCDGCINALSSIMARAYVGAGGDSCNADYRGLAGLPPATIKSSLVSTVRSLTAAIRILNARWDSSGMGRSVDVGHFHQFSLMSRGTGFR